MTLPFRKPVPADRTVDVMAEILQQVQDTEAALARPADAYFHFPQTALDAIVGGMAPDDLWYVGGFSGHGKTTFMTSLAIACLKRGDRVWYLGLESTPHTVRTHLACKILGYDAGDLLSGAYLQWPNHAEVRQEVGGLVRDMGVQAHDVLRVSPVKYVDETVLWAEMERAAAWGATVFLVDHVDHIQGEGRGLYEQSVSANQALFEGKQEFPLRILAATQFNNEAVKGKNRIALHTYPLPNYVLNGGHKRSIADGMLALVRPLKFGVTKEEMVAYRSGFLTSKDVVEPDVMAVYCLKHRKYGKQEGARVYLKLMDGCVHDTDQVLFQARASMQGAL